MIQDTSNTTQEFVYGLIKLDLEIKQKHIINKRIISYSSLCKYEYLYKNIFPVPEEKVGATYYRSIHCTSKFKTLQIFSQF